MSEFTLAEGKTVTFLNAQGHSTVFSPDLGIRAIRTRLEGGIFHLDFVDAESSVLYHVEEPCESEPTLRWVEKEHTLMLQERKAGGGPAWLALTLLGLGAIVLTAGGVLYSRRSR